MPVEFHNVSNLRFYYASWQHWVHKNTVHPSVYHQQRSPRIRKVLSCCLDLPEGRRFLQSGIGVCLLPLTS